jgi:hypothetical protein
MQEENMRRIIWGNAYYSAVHNVWPSRLLCKSIKIKVHINTHLLVLFLLMGIVVAHIKRRVWVEDVR